MTGVSNFLNCRRGAVLVEAAIALPFLITVLLGILQISFYLQQRGSMERASSSSISLAAQMDAAPSSVDEREGLLLAFRVAAGLSPGDDYGILICEVMLDASGTAEADGSSNCSGVRRWLSEEEGSISGLSGYDDIGQIESSVGTGSKRRFLLLKSARKVDGMGNFVPGLNTITTRHTLELPREP